MLNQLSGACSIKDKDSFLEKCHSLQCEILLKLHDYSGAKTHLLSAISYAESKENADLSVKEKRLKLLSEIERIIRTFEPLPFKKFNQINRFTHRDILLNHFNFQSSKDRATFMPGQRQMFHTRVQPLRSHHFSRQPYSRTFFGVSALFVLLNGGI